VVSTGKKPGYPLQSFLPLRGKNGFPLLSLARAPAAKKKKSGFLKVRCYFLCFLIQLIRLSGYYNILTGKFLR
jgi:hypothetical protein